MTFGLHLVEPCGHFAVRTDQVGGARNAHVLLAIHGFFLPRSIGGAQLRRLAGGGLVREQGERQLVLLDEFHMARGAVWAHAEDFNTCLAQLRPTVSEGACFHGATGRVVLWIEVHDDGSTLEFGKRSERAGLVGSGESGSLTARIQEGHGKKCTRQVCFRPAQI